MSSKDKHNIIILGAGRGTSGTPSVLINTSKDSKVFDWILESFSNLKHQALSFIGGYKAREVMYAYPKIHYILNSYWREYGPAQSLSLINLEKEHFHWVSYSDVVFRENIVSKMEKSKADIVLAVDSKWKERYERRSLSDIENAEKVFYKNDNFFQIGKVSKNADKTNEYVGLVKFSPKTYQKLNKIFQSHRESKGSNLTHIIQELFEDGFSVETIDIEGDWAELNAPQDLARFILGTKAESLSRLRPLVKKSKIETQISFTHEAWKNGKEKILRNIQSEFSKEIIIRSSSIAEDCWDDSSAGAFKSILGADPKNIKTLEENIIEVFESYSEYRTQDQVLVQPMTENVSMSGVVMTRNPSNGAPYYVINLDDQTSKTDTVTSGTGELRTFYLYRNSEDYSNLPKEISNILESVKELESLIGHDSLDIEFAVTKTGSIHVFQVRPIAFKKQIIPVDNTLIEIGIRNSVNLFKSKQTAQPNLYGKKTQYSVMTDWNPAEIIGTKPRRLAHSLYKYIITDSTWAKQRAEFGYKDVQPCNLLVDFLGHPYVDIRATFNSFLPVDLSQELGEKLFNFYLNKLNKNPTFHDKAEFKILFTCLDFSFDERKKELQEQGFTQEEITSLENSIRKITKEAFKKCQPLLEAVVKGNTKFLEIKNSDISSLQKIYFYLENCRTSEALNFSHLARHGFIAMTLLKTLEESKSITRDELDNFLESLSTVSSIFQNDAYKVQTGKKSWDSFVEDYGHLRPGTYEITSPNYASAKEEVLRPMIEKARAPRVRDPLKAFSKESKNKITEQLKLNDLDISYEKFIKYLKDSIEGREYGKFVFTRGLNESLQEIEAWGKDLGFGQDALSHLDIDFILSLKHSSRPQGIKNTLNDLIDKAEELHFATEATSFPSQLTQELDFTVFEQAKSEPNFITRNSVQAKLVHLDEVRNYSLDLTGTIVIISQADPGFDWLFSRPIKGLITQYGGINSHMAIRAAEFNLPAAIGVGELLYERLLRAEFISLDCSAKKIKLIN